MRRLIATALVMALVSASAPAFAQATPLPDLQDEAGDAPAVRIRPDKQDKVEKAVVGGRTILKVTPPGGRPYYLVEGPGGWERRGSLDDGTRVPMWTIHSFD
jgi:hypothetical protein